MTDGDLPKKDLRRQRRADKIVAAVETAKAHQQTNRAHLKLSHPRHTGRKLPIHSTSYAALFFLLLFTGVFLFFVSQSAVSAGPPIVQNGDIQVGGLVPGPPPENPAVITSPANGSRFTETIITVSGTCDSGLLVEIYRNNAFAGSQICDSSGHFSLKITIIPGQNTLIARVSDSLGQYGPDSNTVTVYLDPVAAAPGSSAPSPTATVLPFLIYTQPVQRGLNPKQTVTLAYEVDGGQPPYAISIDWGDDSEDNIVALSQAGDFQQTHIYEKPGQYVVSISGTDNAQNKAFTQSIVIVNGPVPADDTNLFVFGSTACSGDQSIICRIISSTDLLWPVFIIASTMTLSFWMGEQLVLRKYKRVIKNA